MRTLVIGATGYLGSNVGRSLAAAGHEVVGLSRRPDRAAFVEGLGMRAMLGDVEAVDSLGPMLGAFDAVIFSPQMLMEAEQQAVAHILDRLGGTGKTFVFTSGTGVIGQRTAGAWSEDSFAEDDAFVPLKALAMRVETERLVREAAGRGVRTMVVRPPRVWGHGARGHVSLTYDSVGRTGAACFIGAGLNLYSNVHVDDLCDLYVRALDRGVGGALYHAVSGETPNRWIAEAVARDMGCDARSVTMDEAIGIWGKYQTLIVLGVSSRSRSPRSRRELGWAPTRFDMLSEVGRPEFRALAKNPTQAEGTPIEGRAASLIGH